MLHPNQFYVNEAWIAFQVNDAPITTGSDGDFNLIALMDAASCFLLSPTLVPGSAEEPSTLEVKRLLKEAQVHKQQMPEKLFIPSNQTANFLTIEAERLGVTVVRVQEDQLLQFIGEARETFRERFSGGSIQ